MTPPPSPGRLSRLARVSPTTAFVLALAVLLAGLFAPGILGAALLFALGAGLAALTFTTWPVQSQPTRLARLSILIVLLAVAVRKVL